MTSKEIKQIREMNPYPLDVFPEPKEDDWKGIGNFLISHGRNPDKIFARFGRMVWDNCVNQMNGLTDKD